MTDEKLEQVKLFFTSFSNEDDFIQKYIQVNNPKNAKDLIKLFGEATQGEDIWEIRKFLLSKETLRLDKIMSKNQNITIQDIINTTKKYNLSKYKRIMINLDNKNYDDIEELSNLGVDVCIKISGDKGICTLDEFKK